MNNKDITKMTAAEVASDLSIPVKQRVQYALCTRNAKGECIEFPPTVSARTLLESRLIYWLKSYKALLKYVSIDYFKIFDPNVRGSRSGTRYEIKTDNIIKFLEMFESNEFSKPENKGHFRKE